MEQDLTKRYENYDRLLDYLDQVSTGAYFASRVELQKVFHQSETFYAMFPEDTLFNLAMAEMEQNGEIKYLPTPDKWTIETKGKQLLRDGGYSKRYQVEQKEKGDREKERKGNIRRNSWPFLFLPIVISLGALFYSHKTYERSGRSMMSFQKELDSFKISTQRLSKEIEILKAKPQIDTIR